jgi:hypothetical protein
MMVKVWVLVGEEEKKKLPLSGLDGEDNGEEQGESLQVRDPLCMRSRGPCCCMMSIKLESERSRNIQDLERREDCDA